jgi:hypothetical protein
MASYLDVEVKSTGDALSFPQRCACCGGIADAKKELTFGTAGRGNVTHITKWHFPYCTLCHGHDKRKGAIILLALAPQVAVFGILIGILGLVLPGDGGSGLALIALGVGALGVWGTVNGIRQLRVQPKKGPNCGVPPWGALPGGVRYLSSKGNIHKFRLYNTSYAEDFRLLNSPAGEIKEKKMGKSGTDPTCSFCSRRLSAVGQNRYDQVIGSLPTLYSGVICKTCRSIACIECQGNPPNKPCKKCGGEVAPAYADTVAQDS